jgi:ribonucleoside-diphosphate reductase alpha chain
MSAPAQSAPRRRMPRHRAGYTTSIEVAGAEFYLTANPHADGSLGEVFIKFGKQGSTLGGLLDAVSISVSLGLQSGISLETFAGKYIDMRFEPMGLTDDPLVPNVASVLDYVFRRLALDFLDAAACERLGVATLDDEARDLVSAAEQ